MEAHYNVRENNYSAVEEADPLLCGVRMSEIKVIADGRSHSSKLSRPESHLFKIPSQKAIEDKSFRGKCTRLINSFKFQTVVIGFVILDCIFVVSELIVDLRITKGEVCDRVTCAPIKKDRTLSLVLQSLGLAILSLFIVELIFKLWALRLKSKMEIFDAIIVIVSGSLDVAFFNHDDDFDAASMLIFLRMWRLIRIVYAIAMSAIAPVTRQLEQEEHAHHVTGVKLEKFSDYSKDLEVEIKELRRLLVKSDEPFPRSRVKVTTAGLKDL